MATVFSRTYAKPHGYTLQLAKFFEPIRAKPIKLVEIGVGGGESIRTWLEYFPKASVFGVDVVKNTNSWNTVGAKPHPRYAFNCADQSDLVFWKCFLADFGSDWNVVIDDGGHEARQIQASFASMWPSLSSGGFYCVEDLAFDWANNAQWLTGLMMLMNQDSLAADSICFSKELAVLTKK